MPPIRRKPPVRTSSLRKPKVAGRPDAVPAATEPTPVEPTPVEPKAAGPDGAATDTPDGTHQTTVKPARPGRARLIVAAVFLVLALIGAGLSVFFGVKPGVGVSNTAYIDTAGTREASAFATEAITAMLQYNYTTVDKDFEHARTYLTADMQKQFDSTAPTSKSAIGQGKTATQVHVDDVGIQDLAGDIAKALLNVSVSSTSDGVVNASVSGPVSMSLVRQNGHWLVSALDQT